MAALKDRAPLEVTGLRIQALARTAALSLRLTTLGDPPSQTSLDSACLQLPWVFPALRLAAFWFRALSFRWVPLPLVVSIAQSELSKGASAHVSPMLKILQAFSSPSK